VTDPVDAPVPPELAIEIARGLRKKLGGALRLWTTALLITPTFFGLVGLLEGSWLLGLLFVGGAAVLIRNFIQNARALAIDDALRSLAAMPQPLVGELRDRTLAIGNAALPRGRWARIRLTRREERQIRTKALPVARVV